ncbi:hypothetical protein Tco_1286084 [Tanacetum coccineum]
MKTANQGMSIEEIKQIVAHRVANAIEAIAIYETKTSMAREEMSQTKRQGDKVIKMLATRGSGKVTTMEALTNNKTKSIRCLEHTLLGQATRRNMLELYLCATSARCTTMGRVLKDHAMLRVVALKLLPKFKISTDILEEQNFVQHHLIPNPKPKSQDTSLVALGQFVDALSKIASMSFAHLSKQVLVEELKEKSISEVEILAVVEEEGDTWMTPIFEYPTEETLPADVKKARAV